MFVSGLTLCIFVVWTNKGIFTVEVPCDPSFMSIVCAKLEKFWTSQVLPFLISEVSLHPFQVSSCKDLSPNLLHLTLVISDPFLLKFSCNLRFMRDPMLRMFFCCFYFLGGGLPEQIHHKKHFALPKIPAFQSNT